MLPTLRRDQTQASPNPKPSRMEDICDRGLHQGSEENEHVMEDLFNENIKLRKPLLDNLSGAATDGKSLQKP